MTATRTEARDQVFELVDDAFAAGVVQPAPEIVYQDQQNPSLWTGSKPWLHVSMFYATGGQVTLANINGKKRYRRNGNVVMQVHAPLDYDGDLLGLIDNLNDTGEKSVFNKITTGGVEFDSVIASEIGRNGPWYISTVTAAFRYDEIV